MDILHIDFEKTWRGGQQQAVYLYRQIIEHGIHSNFICSGESKLTEYFKKNNLPYYNVNIMNELDVFAALKIARFIKKNKFSILVLHSAHALSIALLLKILFAKNIKLIPIRRVDFSIRKNFLSFLKYSNKYIDKLVVISDFIRHVLIRDGIPKEKLELVYSAIDLQKFNNLKRDDNFIDKYNIPCDNIIIGTIAALVDHKDYPTLLRAAQLVLEFRKDVTFFIVGDGYLKKELIKLTDKMNISNNIIFAGFIEEAWRLLPNFDIFLITSKMEGLGTTLLDAQAVGLPIIATEGGGIPEIIKDGYNGLLAPIGDYKQVANLIINLLDNKELKHKLSYNSKIFVKNFTIENQFSEYMKLFKSL